MPIVVDHQPNPAMVGAAALAAGYGQYAQRQNEIARDQSNRNADRNAQLLGMQLDELHRSRALGMDAYQASAQRDFAARRQEDQQEFEQGSLYAQQDFRQRQEVAETAQRSAEQQRQFEERRQLADRQAQQAKDLFDYRWTAKQRSEIEQLANHEAAIQSASHLEPQEKERLLFEVRTRRAGMRPLALPKNQKVTIADRIQQGDHSVWADPDSGARFIVSEDRSGALRYTPIEDTTKKTAEERTRWQRTEAAKIMREAIPQPDGSSRFASWDEAVAEAGRRFDSVQLPPSSPAPQPGQQGPPVANQRQGLPPIPPEWIEWGSVGQPQQGPALPTQQARVQPQQGTQQPQSGQQSRPQAFYSPVLRKRISVKAIQEAAAKRGVPPGQLMIELQIEGVQ